MLKNWKIVKVATTKAQRKLFFNLRSKKKRLGWMNVDEIKRIADDLGVSVKDVQEMEGRLAAHDATFDAPAADGGEDIGNAPVYFLKNNAVDPAVALENDDWKENTHGKLYAAVATLDERSRDILQRRWLADQKSTLIELATHYGISAERIRQLEANALKKMRASIAA